VVYIHCADNLNGDTTQCNPYCMLFNNRKKVKVIFIIFYNFNDYVYANVISPSHFVAF